MSGWGRFLVSALATAAFASLLAGLSGFPYERAASDSAGLRLSWRTRAAAVRQCREPTPEELAQLPAHMRRDRICDWRVPPHRLRVAVDGRVVEDARIEAAGAREDRPLYVHRELSLEPGVHRVEVRFFLEPRESGEEEATTTLVLRQRIALAAGEVALVTYDRDIGRLVVRRSGGR